MARGGRRRRSGIVGQTAPTHREVAREARLQETRIARRRIFLAVLVSVALVAGAVALTNWFNRAPEVTPPVVEAPPDSGASMLLGLTDDEGSLASVALVSAHSSLGSRIVLFPPSLAAVLPGYGERDVSDAVAFGGVDLLRLTITNLLGIRVDSVGVASVADFVSVFADPLSVELTQPLIVASGSGETVEFGQGRADRDADELARLLSEQGTGDQLALLVRQGAVWEAAFAAAADDGSILDRILEALGLASDVSYQALSTAVVADPLLISAIPTNRAVGVGPDAERYTVSTEDGAAFVDEVLEYLRIADEPRVRVEILNGNGMVGTTAPIARVLIESGFRVVFTDNADQQDYALSRFIAQGPNHQQAAVVVQRLLGSGEVFLEQRQPSGVVDLTIIVGSDLATQG